MFLVRNENSAMYSKCAVVNFNDVIRIAHCALNIELTQPVIILTFE